MSGAAGTTRQDQQSTAQRARRVIPGGVNSGQRVVAGCEDLVVAATSGSSFTTTDGRQFTDYHAAFGPPLLGHNDPDVDAAVSSMARTNDLLGVGVTDVEVQLAEKLVEHIPSAEKVLLTVTGSEATFHAIRLARAATGRDKIIKFQGCYHGWHDAVAMNVITPAERMRAVDPLSSGMLADTIDKTLVAAFNDAHQVEELLTSHHGEIAAIIVEPIAHNVGALLPEEGFLQRLRDLATQHGVVLIFDEVITGFRHGLGGWQSHAAVTPDLTTLGKAMGNGYPISALCGRADLMDMFSTTPGRPVFFAGTFNGHPAMAAAALATITKLEQEPVHEHVFGLGEQIRDGLQKLYASAGIAAVISGFGSVFVSYFLEGPVRNYADLLRNDTEMFIGYRARLLEHGIFELPLNLKRSHVSYAHTTADVERLLDATESVISELT